MWLDLLDEANPEPVDGQWARVVRIYAASHDGWLVATMAGRMRMNRPDLGREGWAADYSEPGGHLMMDDMTCATTNVDEVSLPLDFDRDLLPGSLDEWRGRPDRIFWKGA